MNSTTLTFQDKMGVYDENSQWLQLGFAREKLLTETVMKLPKHFLSSKCGGIHFLLSCRGFQFPTLSQVRIC